MILTTFTLFHVALSVAGILSGLVVMYGLLTSQRLDRWTAAFLGTTLITSLTGFLFPFHGFKPSYAVGVLSVILLALSIAARYRYQLEGGWRRTYVLTAVASLYFNVFVLVAQSFEKIPALNALGATGGAFKVTQAVTLVAFVGLGYFAAARFHVSPAVSAPAVRRAAAS
jgi:hypothetical protein